MPKKTVEEFYQQAALSPEAAIKLTSHFDSEINRALTDRADLEDKWERAHDLFEGKREPKNHPWIGASNIHVPMVASHVVAIHARFMTTLFAPEPFWRVRAKDPEFKDFADDATEYMDWARQNLFDWYTAVRDFSLDAINPGLGILKLTWERLKGKTYCYNDKYEIVENDEIISDKPKVESIPPNKFVWPAGYDNIQTCPWIAHIIEYTPGELKRLGASGYFQKDGVKKAIWGEQVNDERDNIDVRRDEHEGVFPSGKPTIKVFDVWGRWDVNGDGIEEEMNVVFEAVTGTILRCNPNPYFHQKRPFVIGRLEPRAHRMAGLSIADQIGDLNEEANTVHNQTVDATTVSICQMFGVRAGSPAEAALDRIHPGKKIPYTMETDIREISMGPLKTNSFSLEELARIYAERRTGISDFSMGREPNPSRRGTATGTLAIIQEGNKKFDFQIRDMRQALGEAGMMLLSMMQQMNPEGIMQKVLGADASDLKLLQLSFPKKPLDTVVSIEVTAGTSTINRQVQRQDALSLFQLMMNFYQQALQMGQLLATPGLPPPFIHLATQIASGSKALMAEILQSFEERREEELIPDLEEIYAALGTFSLAQGAALGPGLPGAPGGAPQAGPPGPQPGNGGQPQPPRPGVSGPGPTIPGAEGGF